MSTTIHTSAHLSGVVFGGTRSRPNRHLATVCRLLGAQQPPPTMRRLTWFPISPAMRLRILDSALNLLVRMPRSGHIASIFLYISSVDVCQHVFRIVFQHLTSYLYIYSSFACVYQNYTRIYIPMDLGRPGQTSTTSATSRWVVR